MIWKICFAMSLIFLAAGAVMFIYKRYHGKGGVRYLGGGVFLSAVSICFPVMHLTEKDGFALAMSISQSIRMFVIDTGTSDILDVLQQDALGSIYIPYKIVVCILYLLGPVFTLSVVLRYFSNFFERLRIFFSSRKNLYIFSVPDWGPSIEGLDMDHIATYVRPKTDMKNDWKDVPQDIKDTFERLG